MHIKPRKDKQLKLVRFDEVIYLEKDQKYKQFQEAWVNPDKVFMLKPAALSFGHTIVIFDADANPKKVEEDYLVVEGSCEEVAVKLAHSGIKE